jgi:hypothetical protein
MTAPNPTTHFPHVMINPDDFNPWFAWVDRVTGETTMMFELGLDGEGADRYYEDLLGMPMADIMAMQRAAVVDPDRVAILARADEWRKADTRIHPETGEQLRRDIRPKTVTVGSRSRTVDVPGWYPEGDGDAVHTWTDLHEFDAAFKELRGKLV